MSAALVIQTSFLGDTVLTTPLLATLAPRGAVDVVCTPLAATLLANQPSVRTVIPYDKRGWDRGIAGFARVVRRLRAAHYDAAYLAQGSMRSGALALAAGISERVGFATSAGRLLYSRRVSPGPGSHHAQRLLALAGEPANGASARPRLYPGGVERSAVDFLLQSGGVAAETPLVVLAPGSVWGTKRWPGYVELARILAPEARIVVVGSMDDAAFAQDIANGVAATTPSLGPAIVATGRLSLLASAELIGRAHVLITNDSLPLHLGSAMNTPTVAIFGPTVPDFGFGPLSERATVVEQAGLSCRPCHAHGPARCPLGHWRCMREVSAAAVADAVGRIGKVPSASRDSHPARTTSS